MPPAIRSDLNTILQIQNPDKTPKPDKKLKKRSVGRPPKEKTPKTKTDSEILPIFDGIPGYKQQTRKTNIKVRHWHWVPFKTPGRADTTKFCHWERIDDVYNSPFTKAYENGLEIPHYSNEEYYEFLSDPEWTKEETDYLLQLLEDFNLRFIVVVDRWDTQKFPSRRLEEIKERYYGIKHAYFKATHNTGESSPFIYDREHEKNRRHQLDLLLSRTADEEAEEEMLVQELKKIESRRRGHERKTQDLQKIIKVADVGVVKNDKRPTKKRPCVRPRNLSNVLSDNNLIRFTEIKGPAIYLSSQKIKLPNMMGNKMVRQIEDSLAELNVDAKTISSEERCTVFNELRQNIVLMHEFKVTLSSFELELTSLRHQYEIFVIGNNASSIINDSLNECIQLPQEIEVSSPDVGIKRRMSSSDKVEKRRK